MCTYFKTKTNIVQNLIDDFFLIFTVSKTFHRKNFKKYGGKSWGNQIMRKKYGGMGLPSEKTEALCAGLNKRTETTTSSCSATCNFLQDYYSALVVKNHQKIWFRCLVHEFFLHRCFLTMLIMVTEQPYWRKILWDCFCFIWLWLLTAVIKRCAKQCSLQLHRTSLIRFDLQSVVKKKT